MNFSIIGSGFIMPRHAEAINAVGGKIIDIVNTARGEETWREAIKNPATDCVVILTPNDLHFDIAVAASEAGKIVLSEKPLTINSAQAKILAQKQAIYTVLQLRYHPQVIELRKLISPVEKYEIEMDIAVWRDLEYYNSWKGQPKRSGGLLFNLGIHYFDLLIHLFGDAKKIATFSLSDKSASGVIVGINYLCRWWLSTDEPRETQRRVFKVNGVNYNFSSQDNLSYENLHRTVYQDLLQGKGILPAESLKSIRLVEQLYKAYGQKS